MKPIVQTKQGPVQGLSQNGYLVFKGVPYAAAPVGDLRWRAPQPAPVHENVLDCTEFACQCPHRRMPGSFYWKEFYSEPGDLTENNEDCLYLNIWAPENAKDLPVLFWIHGGAFLTGSGSEKEFGGEAYAKRGIITVTINYRLGSFGFLALPELADEDPHHSTGNYGVLDQLAALQWVHDNIAAFGGDPSRITLDGQSAGAMSVQTQLSTPLSKGLFRAAILQSGGGIDRGLVADHTREKAYEFGEIFRQILGGGTAQDFRKLDPETLLNASAELAKQTKTLPFRPVMDGYFLTESFHDVLFKGHIADVPCILGSNTEDIGIDRSVKLAEGEHTEIEQGCINFALGRRTTSDQPTYVYRFCRQLPGDDAGAFHSAELWYMFGTLDRCWRPMTDHDHELSEEMLDAWAAFVKGEAMGWKPYTAEDPEIRIFE